MKRLNAFLVVLLVACCCAWALPGAKNNSGKGNYDHSAGDVDLSGIAGLVTERNNRNIEKLRELSDSLGSGNESSGDNQRIAELVSELRAEQQDNGIN